MSKNLILKEHIQGHLIASKESYQSLAEKIRVSPSTLFNWGAGGPVTLNEKNIHSLQILADEIDIDLPFLLFPLELAERLNVMQRIDSVMGLHLKNLWSELSREIRTMVRAEMLSKK